MIDKCNKSAASFGFLPTVPTSSSSTPPSHPFFSFLSLSPVIRCLCDGGEVDCVARQGGGGGSGARDRASSAFGRGARKKEKEKREEKRLSPTDCRADRTHQLQPVVVVGITSLKVTIQTKKE